MIQIQVVALKSILFSFPKSLLYKGIFFSHLHSFNYNCSFKKRNFSSGVIYLKGNFIFPPKNSFSLPRIIINYHLQNWHCLKNEFPYSLLFSLPKQCSECIIELYFLSYCWDEANFLEPIAFWTLICTVAYFRKPQKK